MRVFVLVLAVLLTFGCQQKDDSIQSSQISKAHSIPAQTSGSIEDDFNKRKKNEKAKLGSIEQREALYDLTKEKGYIIKCKRDGDDAVGERRLDYFAFYIGQAIHWRAENEEDVNESNKITYEYYIKNNILEFSVSVMVPEGTNWNTLHSQKTVYEYNKNKLTLYEKVENLDTKFSIVFKHSCFVISKNQNL